MKLHFGIDPKTGQIIVRRNVETITLAELDVMFSELQKDFPSITKEKATVEHCCPPEYSCNFFAISVISESKPAKHFNRYKLINRA